MSVTETDNSLAYSKSSGLMTFPTREQHPVSQKYPSNEEERGDKVGRIHPSVTIRDIGGARGLRRSSLTRIDSLSSFSSLKSNEPLHRSFSDTLLTRGASSSQRHSSNLPRTNATFHAVQRSGAPLIRDTIASIDRKTSEGCPPEKECTVLTNCAQDPYYRVIIAANGGIMAVIKAMTTFPDEEEVQAKSCAMLATVSSKNASNQKLAAKEGGLDAVLQAMRTFPLSIAVQSAACDALNNLTSMTPANVEALKQTPDLQGVLWDSRQRFLPPSCRESAETVLRRVSA